MSPEEKAKFEKMEQELARYKKLADPMQPNFTKFPNIFLDDYLPMLSGVEYKIVSLIVRQTYGFRKKADYLYVPTIAKRCGVSDRAVQLACKELTRLGILAVIEPSNPVWPNYIDTSNADQMRWKAQHAEGVRSLPSLYGFRSFDMEKVLAGFKNRAADKGKGEVNSPVKKLRVSSKGENISPVKIFQGVGEEIAGDGVKNLHHTKEDLDNINPTKEISPHTPEGDSEGDDLLLSGEPKSVARRNPDVLWWKPERFEELWSIHIKTSRKLAIRAWNRLQPSDATIDLIKAYLIEAHKSHQWAVEGAIPYLSTILNKERWTDDVTTYNRKSNRPYAMAAEPQRIYSTKTTQRPAKWARQPEVSA